MKSNSTLALVAASLISCLVTPAASAEEVTATATTTVVITPTPQRVVEIAICLDTSGSMDGLIDAARQKIWAIVNELALAKPTPKLRVALLSYGNDGYPAESGWVAIDVPFTDDLDLISQHLFALKTNGGTELVARVMNRAGQLDWSTAKDSLQLMVVAGNEAADQDTVLAFRDVCRQTIARGIMVNSIYCGNPSDELAPAWREVATLTDGSFAAIDQNKETAAIASPFDAELAALSSSLNETYIPVGASGQQAQANQALQDDNANEKGLAVGAMRSASKAGKLYHCGWDLIDQCKNNPAAVEEISDADLPENVRKLSMDERKKYVADLAAKRQEIQAKIDVTNQKRVAYVQVEMEKQQAAAGEPSFESALTKAVREQAQKKAFTFEVRQPVEVPSVETQPEGAVEEK